MATGCRVLVDGPLASFAEGIEKALVADGYTEKWLSQLMWLTADLSCWLGKLGLGAGELTGAVSEDFFAAGGASRSRCSSPRSLKPIVAYLRSVGALRVEDAARLGRSEVEDELLSSFGRWCVAQRGLTAYTRRSTPNGWRSSCLCGVLTPTLLWPTSTDALCWALFALPPMCSQGLRCGAWSRRCVPSCGSCTPRGDPRRRW